MRHAFLVLILAATLSTGASCPGGARAPILVAQSGVALTASIGQISEAASALTKANVLPAASALQLQERLLTLNTALKPLPDLLRTIDAAQKAGQSPAGDVERALAILQVVSPQISVLLAGVPIAASTQQIITLVRTAQQTITTVLLEVAKLRQPPSARIYERTTTAA